MLLLVQSDKLVFDLLADCVIKNICALNNANLMLFETACNDFGDLIDEEQYPISYTNLAVLMHKLPMKRIAKHALPHWRMHTFVCKKVFLKGEKV